MDQHARACIVSDRSIEREVETWIAQSGCVVEVCLKDKLHAQAARILRLPDCIPELDGLPERHLRYLSCADRSTYRLAGGLLDNDFSADLLVTVGLQMKASIAGVFEAYLGDNIFGAFKSVCVCTESEETIAYQATLPLNSTAYRDVRHELPAFALRSGEQVMRNVRVEIFNEDGNLLQFGELSVPAGSLSSARIFIRDPSSQRRGMAGFGQPLTWK